MKISKHATKRLDFVITSVKDASATGGDCVIAGYANTATKDRVGDVVQPVAFEKTLPTYLKNPILLANHDWNDPIGRTISAQITDKGLYVEAKISDTRPDIKQLIREKVLSTFSIGYNELDADFDETTKTKYIKELELLEISIVSVPANTEASFTEVSADQGDAAPAEGDDKPKADDSEKSAKSDSLGDCLKDNIPRLMDEGYEQDQAIAIAYSECGEKGYCSWKGRKTAKPKGKLLDFIAAVKDACGIKELGKETVIAIGEYFNMNEDTMTKDELLKQLRAKSVAGVPAPAAKADGDQAGEGAKPGAGEEQPKPEDMAPLKQLAAKIDAMAEAMAQMLEMLNKLQQEEEEESAESKPDDSKPSDDQKPAKPEDAQSDDDSEKSAAECEKCGGDMKAKDDAEGGMKCEKCGHEAGSKGDGAGEEMKDEDIEKNLAVLDAQIRQLEDSNNG